MRQLQINNRIINDSEPVFIIAEIGINHQGRIDIAKKLIVKAKECGADAVKFQKRSINRILTKEGLEMPYDNRNSFGSTYGEHKIALELSEDDYKELIDFTNKQNLLFSASGWDEESVDFLLNLGVPFLKMASADLSNFPLVEHTAKTGLPVILSTGMADMELVTSAYELFTRFNPKVAIMQCTSTYPARFDELHLNVIHSFRETFSNAVIGYSGHELGIAIPGVAVALGARIIERHFTLDRTMKGGDHAASLEPQGFAKMVRDIRHIEQALGESQKTMQNSEKPIFKKLGKSIVAINSIPKGSIISEEMLTTKGPGSGISPTKFYQLIGKTTANDIREDSIIHNEDIVW